MHSLRPFAILLAILTIPAVLGWGVLTALFLVLFYPRNGQSWLDLILPCAAMSGILLMGWVSLASLFWTVRHFNAYITPTPRWVLAGYLFGALVLAFLLPGTPATLANVLSLKSSLGYIAGPGCLLLLALWRLWRIRRFYAINIAKMHQYSACEGDADGTLAVPSDHPATPCSSDPPAASR